MDNIILWLQLHFVFGGTVAGGSLLRQYGTAQNIFAVSPAVRVKTGEISANVAERLERAASLQKQARAAAAACRNFGWQVVTPENGCYPVGFRRLKDPPLALFAAGDPTWLTRRGAAVVGTRNAADVCLTAAYDIGAALSGADIVTVSGGALGIDSAAHEGALTSGCGTVCVLGCGLGNGYLPEKALMRRRIEKHGVVITELPPFEAPGVTTFPRRNRLISGLSETLTVVQSNEQGGSMISVKFAREQGVKLFALDPSVYPSSGCEALLKEGAVPLADTGPLLSYYGAADLSPWDLHNNGQRVPPVLTPTRCTPAQFARLNGVTEAQALPLYEELLARKERGEPLAEPRIPAPGRAGEQARPTGPRPPSARSLKEKMANAAALSGDERAVFMALEQMPQTVDALAEATGLPAAELMAHLTLLELKDLAVTAPGNRAALKLT